MLLDSQKGIFPHKEDALLRMLNLNEDIEGPDAPMVWKVLIYDKYGQNIISPILRLGELKNAGVTLHMYIVYLIKVYLERTATDTRRSCHLLC